MKILILLILSPFFLFSQIQIHTDIDGKLTLDNSGHSVSSSSDGSIVAIGSPSYDDVKKGLVRVFENNGDAWIQIGDDIIGEYTEDHFGCSVSLSSDGSIVVISGPDADTAGYARVYQNISNVWTQIGDDIIGPAEYIDSDGWQPNFSFGRSVSISDDGTIIAIAEDKGSFWEAGYGNDGYMHIYMNISGIWTLIGEPIYTGISYLNDITLSGNGSVVAVSGSGDCPPPFWFCPIGYVKVYNNISGVWIQIGSTFSGTTYPEDSYYISGVSVTNDGSKIAIGGTNTRVYENIEDEWVQLGEDIETGGFMPKVSLSDNANILAIGGPVTRLYENDSGNWTQLGADINQEATGDNFGASLELSGDGLTLTVGGPKNDGNGDNSGHVRVYDLTALLSVEESKVLSIRLYPNPAKYQFTIKLNDNSELKNAHIYNNLGQLVLSSKETTINTMGLSTGLYVVEIETTKGKGSKKLIIE